MFSGSTDPVSFRVKKLIRLLAAGDVGRGEACLAQNAGGQIAALSDLAVDGDVWVVRKVMQARAQVIDGNVHGFG